MIHLSCFICPKAKIKNSYSAETTQYIYSLASLIDRIEQVWFLRIVKLGCFFIEKQKLSFKGSKLF